MKRPFTPARADARALARLLSIALAFAAAPLAAQETDTVRLGGPDTVAVADSFVVVDTILEPDDTLTVEPELADTLAADSAPPLPRLVPHRLTRPLDAGYAQGVFVWDRAALLRSTALTVAELLERVPGLTRVRGGYYTAPEAVVSPFALTGDLEVLIDGFPLDPLTGTTIDLATIAITDLERVRVERRGGRLRVELTPLEHPSPRGGYESTPDSGAAYTRVEIATGDLDTDGLTGVFMAPRFLFGPFVAAVTRLDSDGHQRAQPGDQSQVWLRWAALYARWGVHAEYRRFGLERDPDSPHPGEATRQELVARARVKPWEFFTAELYVGHSGIDDRFIVDSVSTDLSATHVGVRTAIDRGWLASHGAIRLRNGDAGPGMAYELAGVVGPLPWLSLDADVALESWDDESALRWIAGGALGPFFGARVFVEVADGAHGIHWLARPGGTPIVERSTQRAGLDWSYGGWRLGGAAFRAEADSVAPPLIPGIGPFGTRDLALLRGYEMQGFEGTFRVPVYWQPLGLEGWYTRMSAVEDGVLSIFQPVEQARLALVYHDLPLETDQLEIELRVEGEYRGAMLAPELTAGLALATVPASQRLNLDLSIRVLDIHAYVNWSNLLHDQTLQDLPARVLPGQTAFFGVKWELWN